MSRELNKVAYERGHLYYECNYCKGKKIDECGWVHYCFDCDDYVSVTLKGKEIANEMCNM